MTLGVAIETFEAYLAWWLEEKLKQINVERNMFIMERVMFLLILSDLFI